MKGLSDRIIEDLQEIEAKIERVYTISCDNCGEIEQISTGKIKMMTVVYFFQRGWRVFGLYIFCPKCASKKAAKSA